MKGRYAPPAFNDTALDTPFIIMKLHLTQADGSLLITGYDAGWVEINATRHHRSLILLPNRLIENWTDGDFDSLQAADFEPLLPLRPEIVLLGTGERHRFIHPRNTHALTAAGIGIECMTTAAACRTYNILMAEGRHVAAALLIGLSG